MPDFLPPEVKIGDEILWYANVRNPIDPCVGLVVKDPGRSTLTLLVFAEETGWSFRPSCRHKDDPGLLENPQWQQWGCWELSRKTTILNKLDSLMPQITALLARGQKN